jgi:hypothetical protein
MALEVIAIGSDNLVRLDQLQSASSAAYINSALVTFVLKDPNGNNLQTGNVNYVSGSNGRYEGTIPASVTGGLTLDAIYSVQITATYQGTTLLRKLSCVAKYRSNQ